MSQIPNNDDEQQKSSDTQNADEISDEELDNITGGIAGKLTSVDAKLLKNIATQLQKGVYIKGSWVCW